MDVQCPAGLHRLASFSHTADGDDELVAKACGGGLCGDLWIDNHDIWFRKGALLPGGSIRSQTSRADILGETRRASEIWSASIGGDSRAGTGLSVSTNRVTSKMPPAIRYQKSSERWAFRTSARDVFVSPTVPLVQPPNGSGVKCATSATSASDPKRTTALAHVGRTRDCRFDRLIFAGDGGTFADWSTFDV